MAHIAHGDTMPRHRAERTGDAGFTYGDPRTGLAGRPGKDGSRAHAWGDPSGYLVIRFADVVGRPELADELFLLDERMRTLREGGEQTLPEIPVWLAGVSARPLDASS
jgi:hypothetical protein